MNENPAPTVGARLSAVIASGQQEVRAVCGEDRACGPVPLILSPILSVSSGRDEALI